MVSDKELQEFYAIDRAIFERLLLLGFDRNLSKHVVAFWYFLDRWNCFQIMKGKIELMGDWEFNELANESIACLNYMRMIEYADCTERNIPIIPSSGEFEWLFSVVPNLWWVIENKEALEAKAYVNDLKNDIFEKAFCDVIVDVPEDERSLYFTFSRGHELCREELQLLLRRWYLEDRVDGEKIYPIDTLSVRVVVKSVADVQRIIGDGDEVRKGRVNGKHVRVRRWRPKPGQKEKPVGRSSTAA